MRAVWASRGHSNQLERSKQSVRSEVRGVLYVNQCVVSAVRTRPRTFRTGSDQTVCEARRLANSDSACHHAEVAGDETRSSRDKYSALFFVSLLFLCSV